MNELLGWYGHDNHNNIDKKDTQVINLRRFTNHSPSLRSNPSSPGHNSPTRTNLRSNPSPDQSPTRPSLRSNSSPEHSPTRPISNQSPSLKFETSPSHSPKRAFAISKSPSKSCGGRHNQNSPAPSLGESIIINYNSIRRNSSSHSPDRNQSPMRVHSDHDQDADSSDSEQLRVSHLSGSVSRADSPNRLDQGSVSSRGSTPRSGEWHDMNVLLI